MQGVYPSGAGTSDAAGGSGVAGASGAAGSNAEAAGWSGTGASSAGRGTGTDTTAVRCFMEDLSMPNWATSGTWFEMTMYMRGRLNQ